MEEKSAGDTEFNTHTQKKKQESLLYEKWNKITKWSKILPVYGVRCEIF